ncbi:MAG: 4-hydroxy-3-methylbut-2-enyl diphosphate reductase [Allobaculum sp.]|nr:4-hydroxy-3-methylbut-2-enyl diphosphate reductase [Allobaculum sp.]
MKEIIVVPIQGFCKGVVHAIDKAKNVAKDPHYPRPIYVLGSLVHNRFVNESLEDQGLIILEAKNKTRLELLDEIDQGTVIFTAHGVSPAVRQKAQEKHLEVVDASCPFVLSTHRLISQNLEKGSTIFYCGKKGHPEAEGATQGRSSIYLLESIEDIPEGIEGDIFVTNQTTMSILDLQALFQAIAKRYPQARFCDEICGATRVRQNAVQKLAGQNIDLLIVIGDPHSNNTRKLAQIGEKAGIPNVYRIENAESLKMHDPILHQAKRIAITSGASTPTYLKDQVIERLHIIEAFVTR